MLKVNDEIKVIKKISDLDVCKFAEVTGDKNPLHLDEKYAAKTPFGKRIVHGMLIGGYFSEIIAMRMPGEGSIYLEQNLKFHRPVFMDTEITLQVNVEEIIHIQKGIYKLATTAYDCYQNLLVSGYAIIKYKESEK